MSNAIFCHAGRPVRLGAEQLLIRITNQDKVPLKKVHPGEQSKHTSKAEKSVPALLKASQINFDVAFANLKA